MLCYKIRKRAFIPLFLVFLFLFRVSYADWKFQKTKNVNPKCNSYRLKFSETNSISPTNLLEFELYFLQEEQSETLISDWNCKVYLNATTLPFPSFENTNKTKIDLQFSDGSTTYEAFAHRLRGNQKLLLDPETTKILIKSLLENRKVTIQAGRYKTTLTPDDFNKHCKLNNLIF